MIRDLRCPNCGAVLDVKAQRANVIRCDYCETNHLLEPEARSVVAEDSHQFVSKLYRAIDEGFSLDELKDLVIYLDDALPQYSLDYDDIPGVGQKGKARELVLWCRRRGALQPLVDVVLSVRPSIDL